MKLEKIVSTDHQRTVFWIFRKELFEVFDSFGLKVEIMIILILNYIFKINDIQHPMVHSTAASYKTALVPMSVSETTNLALMADTRAVRDRDWQDLRAILQWKMRTRKFLLPFLEVQNRSASSPMTLRLASLVSMVQGR